MSVCLLIVSHDPVTAPLTQLCAPFSNAEGEEYLRQRRLQLPFSFTTGEAVLYNTGPTVDITQFQFNKLFSNSDMKKDVTPGSLVDCFLKQDEAVYTQNVDAPLPVDQVFMDSRALVSVASDSWQGNEATAATSDPVVVKEEAKQSVMAVIDSLGKMAQNGDFAAALQNLEVGDAELVEWESALKRLNQDEDQHGNVRSDLDSILTNDIFDYIDSVLFKEKGDDCLGPLPSSCLSGVQQDPYARAAHFSELCEAQLFTAPSPERAFSPMNGLYASRQQANGVPVAEPPHVFDAGLKLSHQGPLLPPADSSLPPLQQLQLQDIFSPSIELPELTVPDISAGDVFASFPSCGQAASHHVGCPQGVSAPVQQASQLLLQQNNLQPPVLAGTGPLLQNSVQQSNSVAPSVADVLPPLIPCSDFSSSAPNIPVSFPTPVLQETLPFEAHGRPLQQWPQSQQQKLPHAGMVQNGHGPTPAFQSSESQTFPGAGFWPRSVPALSHAQQQGALAGSQAASQNSCMFSQHFSSSPAGGDVLALSGSAGLRGADPSLDQSPPQGSCYFQWSHGDPVVGTSAITQESATVSPLTAAAAMSSAELSSIQHYLDGGRPVQVNIYQPSQRINHKINIMFVYISQSGFSCKRSV